MMFRTQKIRKNFTVIATVTAAAALTATIFAPAGFGSHPRIALWETQPVIFAIPSSTSPGQDLNCAVAFAEETQPEPARPSDAAFKAATSGGKHVTVYSDPVGVVSYSGTVSGSSAVLPAHVSADAAPGPVTVFIETDGSSTVSATTTVTSR